MSTISLLWNIITNFDQHTDVKVYMASKSQLRLGEKIFPIVYVTGQVTNTLPMDYRSAFSIWTGALSSG